jgi:hypothetical protein
VRFCEEAVDRTLEAFGRLDVLVNNAAFQLHGASLEDISEEHLQETLQTNIGGYFHMARAALPHMAEGGSIINCGSETALFGSKESAGLLGDQGRDPCVHQVARVEPARARHPRQCRRAGPVWTPLNPCRSRGRQGRRIRKEERHGAAGAAGGDLAGVRVPRIADHRLLRQRRDTAGHGRAARLTFFRIQIIPDAFLYGGAATFFERAAQGRAEDVS